ncbi:hypothetical protein BSL78_03780 [Apostichopus japonicus]|uniref:Uncharacterized protein n=1 Tax=Stichopus japonicus TaxID=307972 RepID=A0A2G8LGH8_STIJA|nr:hypothetical protein BSL78_03780 [Apostichopus japonicus]
MLILELASLCDGENTSQRGSRSRRFHQIYQRIQTGRNSRKENGSNWRRQTLAAAAAALESCSARCEQHRHHRQLYTTYHTAAIRQNLETIYKAIRHVEGATPVQTPNPTPTPERETGDGGGEPEGSIRVIRQVEDIEASVHDAGNDRQRIKVQLVHPLHMLTTRPTSITVS